MLTRVNTLLSVGWKVGLLAAVCAAGAVGYVGYDGARDRVSETFGPPLEAGRAGAEKGYDWTADRAGRAWDRCESHPEQVIPSAVAVLSILATAVLLRRRGHSMAEAVIGGVTKLVPSPVAPAEASPTGAEGRARNKLLFKQLTDDRLEIERRLKRADEEIQAAKNNATRTAEERAVAAQRLDDKIDADTKARARLARALEQKQAAERELAEVTDDIERLRPLT